MLINHDLVFQDDDGQSTSSSRTLCYSPPGLSPREGGENGSSASSQVQTSSSRTAETNLAGNSCMLDIMITHEHVLFVFMAACGTRR
jgi:hypothetical protein